MWAATRGGRTATTWTMLAILVANFAAKPCVASRSELIHGGGCLRHRHPLLARHAPLPSVLCREPGHVAASVEKCAVRASGWQRGTHQKDSAAGLAVFAACGGLGRRGAGGIAEAALKGRVFAATAADARRCPLRRSSRDHGSSCNRRASTGARRSRASTGAALSSSTGASACGCAGAGADGATGRAAPAAPRGAVGGYRTTYNLAKMLIML